MIYASPSPLSVVLSGTVMPPNLMCPTRVEKFGDVG